MRLPVIVAPMFLVSTPEMVVEACRTGITGTYLAPNARKIEDFHHGLEKIAQSVTPQSAPWAVSMITHKTYDRFDAELAMISQYRPPVVICALGSPARVQPEVHNYGGAVFCDVVTPEQGRKALDAGADGLILICSGAGGHTGTYSAFAFVEEVRSFFDGPLILGGAIGSARGIRAAIELGADFAYMGTRFLASRESMVSDAYRAMIIQSGMSDIITSSAPTGILASWLKASLYEAGFTPDSIKAKEKIDFSTLRAETKAWKTIWGAGQSVGRITAIETMPDIVDALVQDYLRLNEEMPSRLDCWPNQ